MSSNQPPILIHRSRSCTAFYKNDRVASTEAEITCKLCKP